MEREGLDKGLAELPVFAVRYHPPSKEKPYKLQDFKTKAERDKWHETIGRHVEENQGGKIEFYEEPVSDTSSGE